MQMAGPIATLLGAVVQNGSKDEIQVSSFSGEGKVIGLYFSAHWCPPCRAFTPKLADFYKNFKQSPRGDELEIVFVSSDKTQTDFDTYFGDMPWLALPFEKRDVKNSLSTKFKIQGIPTFVLLDGATGSIVTSDGRSSVLEDPKGENFPWKPKPFSEVIKGKLLKNTGEECTDEALKGKVLGIYFSAHWCPPCKGFTPRLVDFYNKVNEAGKNFEIVFSSGDRNEASFKEYFATMPWLALPFQDQRAKQLSAIFEVSGIPMLIIIDEYGKVITSQGRAAVTSDKEGKDFPWKPKPVELLTEMNVKTVNSEPCLVFFAELNEGEEDANALAAAAVMQPVAEAVWEAAKAKKEDPPLRFMVGGDSEVSDGLKDFLQIEDDNLPQILLLNVPEQTVSRSEVKEITTDVVKDITDKFQAGTLVFQSLEGL
ncbi:nucleoredoxin-like [Apostichopus japonicus]